MVQFKYKAQTMEGKKVKGTMAATDENELHQKLRAVSDIHITEGMALMFRVHGKLYELAEEPRGLILVTEPTDPTDPTDPPDKSEQPDKEEENKKGIITVYVNQQDRIDFETNTVTFMEIITDMMNSDSKIGVLPSGIYKEGEEFYLILKDKELKEWDLPAGVNSSLAQYCGSDWRKGIK